MDIDNSQLTVHAYNWEEEDKYTDDDRTAIHAWSLDRDSKPYLLRFQDFPVFCHVELPLYVNRRLYRWSNEDCNKIMSYLRYVLEDDAPEDGLLKMSSKLYYYRQDKKYPMLLLKFRTVKAMKHCEALLNKPRDIKDIGMIAFKVWETEVGSVRKMLTLRKTQYSQWFNITGKKVPDDEKISKLDQEYFVNWQTMNPIKPEETKTWSTHPGLLSFDIETYSDNHNAMPNKYNSKHVAYMLSAIYQRVGKPETRKRYKFLIGDCSEIKDVNVIKISNEVDLCNEFCKIIEKEDPEIIIGYNIFGYDYQYLDARLKRKLQDWDERASRIINKRPYFTSKTWKSSGYGFNQLDILHFPGRISIDMLPLVKRDYKLPKYDLDTVSKYFLDRGKHDIKAKEMFRIYEELQIAIYLYQQCIKEWVIDNGVNKLILKDDEESMRKLQVGILMYQKAIKYKAIFYENIDPNVINQVMDFYEKAKEQMAKVGEYCVEDSELVIDTFEKLNIWIGIVEMSNIVGVPIMDIFTRGQQVRGLSLIYNLAATLGVVLDTRVMDRVDWSGGFVYEPNPGLYDFVISLDFKSLYPSIIMAFNICYSTLIPQELWGEIPIEMCNVFKWTEQPDEDDDDDDNKDEGEDGDKKKGSKVATNYEFRFIKKEYKEGLLPQLVKGLVDGRNDVRGEQKKESEGSLPWTILEKRQLALKMTANSIFGLLGVQEGGKLPLIEGAMCITSKGRELIQYCNQYLRDTYNALIIYNDTDSTMVKLPFVTSNEQTIEWGKKLEKEISAKFPDPLYIEFEKGGRMLCIRKKKYAFWLIDMRKMIKNPKNKSEWIPNPGYANLYLIEINKDAIMTKGIILARRDNCKWQRNVYTKLLHNVMNMVPLQQSLDIILEEATKIYRNQVQWEHLTIIRGLGANYKSESFFMKIFGDEIRKIGKPANPGDRLEYVIVKSYGIKPDEEQLLGYKMRLSEVYVERMESDKPEHIDANYYLEKVLMNCIQQLFYVGYKKELDQIELQNDIDSHNLVLNEMRSLGYGQHVDYYLNHFNNNPMETVTYMLTTDLKNKTTMARRKHISGRDLFDKRLSKTPIKTLVKAIKRDKFEETVKSLASQQLKSRLFPPKLLISN